MTKTENNNTALFVLLVLAVSFLLMLNIGDSITALSAIAVLLISAVVVFYSKKYICKTVFPAKENKLGFTTHFAVVSLASLIPLIISFLAYYPGGMNLDALGQWWQVQDKILNDWHPAMNTILIYLATRIHNSFPFFIFLQIIAYCLSVGFLSASLNKAGIPHIVNMAAVIYLAVNPATLTIVPNMLKDASFAIFAIILFAQLILIFDSDGEWLNKPQNIIAITVILVMTTLMRHNGFFLTVPILVLLFVYKRVLKKIFVILVLFALALVAIKGPFYMALNVSKHDNTLGEAAGIPMAILGNELVNSPNTIDDETHSFLNSIASDEEWKQNYYTGEWDSVKWNFGGTELLKDIDAKTLIKYTFKSILRAPKSAFSSFSCNTRVLTALVGRAYWAEEPYMSDNEYGISFKGVPFLNTLMHLYVIFSAYPFVSTLFWCLSVFLLALLILTVRTIARREYKKLIFVLPILLYDWGTGLLLSGPTYRYFFLNVPLVIAAALISLFVKKKEIEDYTEINKANEEKTV